MHDPAATFPIKRSLTGLPTPNPSRLSTPPPVPPRRHKSLSTYHSFNSTAPITYTPPTTSHHHQSHTTPRHTAPPSQLVQSYWQTAAQRPAPFVSYNHDANTLHNTDTTSPHTVISHTHALQHMTLIAQLADHVRQLALNDENNVSLTPELAMRIHELILVLDEHQQTLATWLCDISPDNDPVRAVITQIRQTLSGGRVIMNQVLETYRLIRSMMHKHQIRILLNDVIAHTSKLGYTISITLLKHNKVQSAKPITKQRPGQEQCLLGDKYMLGHTCSVDYKQAFAMYEEAAQHMYSPAMFNAACMLLNGRKYDIVPDASRAVHYLKQAVALSNIDAMNMLAQQYEQGSGVAKNLELAIDLYHRAANADCVDAMCNLAYLYEHGCSDDSSYIPVDLSAAHAWYTVAADKHKSAKAQNNLAALYYSGAMSPTAQPDLTTAYHWFSLSAQQGNVSAMYNLATMCEVGQGCVRDVEQALVYYTQAAKQKHVQAATSLGYLLFKQQQYQQAYQWLKEAAELNDSTAMFYIGQLYQHGYYVEPSWTVAYQFYTKAAALNNMHAVYELANCLYNGAGCIADVDYAVELYLRCACSGSANAMYIIAQCYHSGTVYDMDEAKAVEWYIKAADLGHGDSAFALSQIYAADHSVDTHSQLAVEYMQRALQLGSQLAKSQAEASKLKATLKRTQTPTGMFLQSSVAA